METRKVVKLPIPIEVVAVTEESVHDVAEWCGGKTTDMGIAIDTLEGPMEAVIDQHHVAKGVEGEFYPIRNDILKKSYKDAPGENHVQIYIEGDLSAPGGLGRGPGPNADMIQQSILRSHMQSNGGMLNRRMNGY